MTYSGAIKNGFKLINKNWQLVLIQIAAVFAAFLSFVILVGVPLAIVFIIFGIDLTGLSRIQDMFGMLNALPEMLSKYFGLVILVLIGIILSATAALSLQVFVLGGTIGSIGGSIKKIKEEFHLKIFFSEGRRLFFPLVVFTTVISLVFIAAASILGLSIGGVAALVSFLSNGDDPALTSFFRIFFSLVLFFIVLITLSITLYGAAAMALKGTSPIKSIKESFKYLYNHEGAFLLYCIVFIGSISIIVALLLLSYILSFIPIIGYLLALIVRWFTLYIGQSYLGLVIIAATFIYYFFTEVNPPQADEKIEPVSGNSTPQSDTSQHLASESEAPLPEKEGLR